MDRRSFLKVGTAVSTLFALPEQVYKSPIRWDLFTSREAQRYSLAAPFSQGGHGYATNGYLAIKTSASEGLFLNADEGRFPDMKKCWDTYAEDSGCWQDLNLSPRKCDVAGRCYECFGKGHFGNVQECHECNGDGSHYNFNDVTHEDECKCCTHCNGLGIVGDLCKACRGEPWNHGQIVELNDGRCLDAANVARITTLGRVQYRELPSDINACVEFRFDRGQGLVMPIDQFRVGMV